MDPQGRLFNAFALSLSALIVVSSGAGTDDDCQDLKVFTRSWFDSLTDHEGWWHAWAAMLFWGFILILLLLILASRHQDRRRLRQPVWTPGDFCTSLPALSPHAKRSLSPHLGRFWQLRVNANCECVRSSFARQRYFASADLQAVISVVAGEAGLKSERTKTRAAQLCEILCLPEGLEVAINSVEKAGVCRRAAIVFIGSHPLFSLRHLSISMSAAIRALLLTCELLVSMLLSVAVLAASGEGHSWRSRDSCKMESAEQHLWKSILIGVGTNTLTLLLARPVKRFRRHAFAFRSTWSRVGLMRSYLRRRKIKDTVVLVMLLICCLFAFFFVMGFLANARSEDSVKFLASGAAVLVTELIVVPCLFALFVALSSQARSIHVQACRLQVRQRMHLTSIIAVATAPAPTAPHTGNASDTKAVPSPAADTADILVVSSNITTVPPPPPGNPSYAKTERNGTEESEDFYRELMVPCDSEDHFKAQVSENHNQWYYAEPQQPISPASEAHISSKREEEGWVCDDPPELLLYSDRGCGARCQFVSDKLCTSEHRELCEPYVSNCHSWIDSAIATSPLSTGMLTDGSRAMAFARPTSDFSQPNICHGICRHLAL